MFSNRITKRSDLRVRNTLQRIINACADTSKPSKILRFKPAFPLEEELAPNIQVMQGTGENPFSDAAKPPATSRYFPFVNIYCACALCWHDCAP